MFQRQLSSLVAVLPMAFLGAPAQAFERLSLTSAGTLPVSASPSSYQASVTPDGRYVVFGGSYSGLVADPGVTGEQIYLRDRVAHTTELISKSTAGVVGNAISWLPTISNDGCRVAFVSDASNLIAGLADNNYGSSNIFVRDRCANPPTTTMVDIGNDGAQGGSYTREARISGDGKTVVFATESALLTLGSATRCPAGVVYLRHLDFGATTALKRADGSCITGSVPDISYDGTRIAFWSSTDYLGKGIDVWQIYLYDTTVGTSSLRLISADANGVPQRQSDGVHGGEGISTITAPAISQDGRMVSFRSRGYGLGPVLISSGKIVSQVYIKDTFTGAIAVSSVDFTNALGNGDSSGSGQGYRPGLSSDGQYAVFGTLATNLSPWTNTFVLHNNFYGGTDGLADTKFSGYPDISPSGRFISTYSTTSLDTTAGGGMFLADLGIPFAPTLTKLTPGGGKMKLDFTPSTASNAVPATSYGALCEAADGTSAASPSGTASPLTVTGLKNGVNYLCSVTAFNAQGSSVTSNLMSKRVGADLTPILMLLLD